ncbi:hypothetical protein AAMO2058_000422100 [Amorphochlora amoebiformis]
MDVHRVSEVGVFIICCVSFIFLLPCLAASRGDVGFTLVNFDGGCNIGKSVTAGLLSFREVYKCNDGTATVTDWDSKTCKSEGSHCDQCDGAGKGVLSFLVFALLGYLALFPMYAARYLGKNLRLVFGILYVCIAFSYFISWTVWVGGCHKFLQSQYGGKAHVILGPAWGLVFLNFCLSTFCGITEFMLLSVPREVTFPVPNKFSHVPNSETENLPTGSV